MRKRKSNYELSRSQVDTPKDVVSVFWKVTHRYRERFLSVLDLGAGDGRFALGGKYGEYLGLEIDPSRCKDVALPRNAKVIRTCAFRHEQTGFAACIGNPPYVRHHDLEGPWRDRIAKQLGIATGEQLNRKCNLFVYFLLLALLKCRDDGLVSTIIPYEWVSRPAASPLREYIYRNKWRVDIYRFNESIFPSVETTSSISIIDKSERSGEWNYFSLSKTGETEPLPSATGWKAGPLNYSARGKIWATRGLSPGTQEVFTLTDGERIHYGLRLSDVYPCVTSLKYLPATLRSLTQAAFQEHFVEAGQKCWLIKSDKAKLSTRMLDYLKSIPPKRRATATCQNRDPWYAFQLPQAPDLLVSSGFVAKSPKVVVNRVGAIAVGAVHGVHGVAAAKALKLQEYISTENLSRRVVAHSGRLRKLEIKQLNAVLSEFCQK